MKYIYLLTLPILLFSCFRTHHGSGRIITETKTVATFNAVDVSNSIDVELTQGNKNEVIVEADDNIIQYVNVENKGGVLHISFRSNVNVSNYTVKVKVTSPAFTKIEANSSADITSTNTITSADKISVTASSSADIDLKVDAPSILADAGSSATINLEGKTQQFEASASSSADINAENLKAESVNATAGSSGTCNVFASVKLNAEANSSGSVNYTGGVTNIVKKESSSGSVSPK